MRKDILYGTLIIILSSLYSCKKDENTTVTQNNTPPVSHKKQGFVIKFVNLSMIDSVSRVTIGGDIGFPDKKFRTFFSYDTRLGSVDNPVFYGQTLIAKRDTIIYVGCTHSLFAEIEFNTHSMYLELQEEVYKENDTLRVFNWPADTVKAVYKKRYY